MRPRWAFVSACALLLPLLCLSPRAAARSPDSVATAVIGEIHFTGSRNFTDAEVAAAARLKPGETVTRQDLQNVANYLAQLGVFRRVNYRYSTAGDKISVQYTLDDAPTVPVLFDNFPWFTDQELSAAIRRAVPLFNGTAPRGGIMLQEMTSAIAKLLPTRGVSGTVQHTLLEQPLGNGMLMQFRLVGPFLPVASLRFGDALAQNSERLRQGSVDLLGKPFSRFRIEVFENEQVRPLYLAAGHIRVQFGRPEARFTGNPDQPISDQKLLVVLPIDPGPVFHLSRVTWNGGTAIQPAELSTLLGVGAGDLADGMKLEGGWQRIERAYSHLGFLGVKVDHQPSFDNASGKVSYQVSITQGLQYHMGKLVVTGLSVEGEDAVRLHWQLPPGQVFDGAYFHEMLDKLQHPTRQIFGTMPIHYGKVGYWLQKHPQTRTVDVLLDFQ